MENQLTDAAAPGNALSATDHRANLHTRIKAVAAGGIGNAVEWYDMAIYAVLAPVFAVHFFPNESESAQLLSAFALFGVGFVMRPIGAVVFGHFGDKVGRRAALSWAVILMSLSTLSIGILPTHSSIGLLAAVLLCLARLLQGLSAGGEWGGSTTFIVEYAPSNRRGLYGSWQQVSVATGFLLGSLVAAGVNFTLSDAAMNAWGWRLPFILGGILGVVGLYLRLNLEETPQYQAAEEEAEVTSSPLLQTLRDHKRASAQAFFYSAFYNVTYYILLTYMPTYLSTSLGYTFGQGLLASTITLAVFAAAIPFMGNLSDRMGRKPLLYLATAGLALMTLPLFLIMNTGNFGVVIACLVLFALLMSCFSGAGPATLAEMFPTKVRFTALGVGYNAGAVVFGAGAPYIATWLIAKTGSIVAPAWYVIFGCVITFALITRLKESAFKPLP
ncbi:MFS transporter [Streptomyces sp. NPDC055105]|uniref:MFS transporter n=1 Tax=Streptomyces sp. NPDC055105 TaxID=3365719 RepID=UPI0037D7B019